MCRYIVSIKVDRSDTVINLPCLKTDVKEKRKKARCLYPNQPAEVKRAHWVQVVVVVIAVVISALHGLWLIESVMEMEMEGEKRGCPCYIHPWAGRMIRLFAQIAGRGQDAWIRVLLDG